MATLWPVLSMALIVLHLSLQNVRGQQVGVPEGWPANRIPSVRKIPTNSDREVWIFTSLFIYVRPVLACLTNGLCNHILNIYWSFSAVLF